MHAAVHKVRHATSFHIMGVNTGGWGRDPQILGWGLVEALRSP